MMNAEGQIVLSNGAVVLKASLRFDQHGMRPHGKALCKWDTGDRCEYVVWSIYFRTEDGQWHAENGFYFPTQDEALARYESVTKVS